MINLDPFLFDVPHSYEYDVWMCGGGTQSAATAALIIQGKIPKPDFALIANTMYEKNTTWIYYETVLKPELAKVGVDLIRLNRSEWTYPSGNGLFTPSGTLLIPAFTTENNKVGKLSNYCTGKWKIDTCDRWLSVTQGITIYRKWLGLSIDEPKRWADKILRPEFYLPLVELKKTRQNCIDLVMKEMGWPQPPRSACEICPNQSDREWAELNPQQLANAATFEREMQKTDPHAWLHKSCIPIDQVVFKIGDNENRACGSGVCFT